MGSKGDCTIAKCDFQAAQYNMDAFHMPNKEIRQLTMPLSSKNSIDLQNLEGPASAMRMDWCSRKWTYALLGQATRLTLRSVEFIRAIMPED